MKKVLLFAVVVAAASMTSCTKDYTCTYDLLGTETVVEYEGLNADEADAAESACDALGGTWE